MGLIDRIFGTHSEREIRRLMPLVDRIEALEPAFQALSEQDLMSSTDRFRQQLRQGSRLDDLLPDAFAAVREASRRVLGMRHYKVQLLGGIVLHQGRIAEMKTGEGKTLVATLPVYLNALAGEGVHVVTVNDYLARRDSEWMGKVYRYLGLSVGLIVHGRSNAERREAYGADITYGTNNEFGFDYLRDNMVTYREERVQRPLRFAIVDEVDSILVDEARTPLIISGMGDRSTDLYERADRFVRSLKAMKVAEMDDKSEYEDLVAGYDYVVDEKAHTAVLTKSGVEKAERSFGIDNLSDADNFGLQHHIQNAMKAHGLMKRDHQYVVKDGEIIIVDDFTGRLMFGRRYSDGLHQAIEAKESVKVERESKTLATITFQNYFRMYGKLSGMTGTAQTEEEEFRAIYKLDVVSIPTNKPMVRSDLADVVYKTQRGKVNAILADVKETHVTGQPILIGTVSVERSEMLSALLKRNGIPHNVLNAKLHDREAEIVAQAGRFGAVTIATNMAGRGTDILLGGNPDFLARQEMRKQGIEEERIAASTAHNETADPVVLADRDLYASLFHRFAAETEQEHARVVGAGGLYIIGTERHESRRIDNQLRGRSGRQGDPGLSRFYLSLEDDLMRLFGGERMTTIFNRLGVEEDVPIENALLSNAIETAQKRVEARNFSIRKHVLEYDDVMNKQREVIYGQRRKVLEGEDLRSVFARMIESMARRIVEEGCASDPIPERWDWTGMEARILDVFGPLDAIREARRDLDRADAGALYEAVRDQALSAYARRESELPSPELMREIERVVLLRTVDEKWMDHIDAMDELRYGIGMRGYGQKDPVMEYKREGFDMFEQMNQSIMEDSVRLLMKGRFRTEAPLRRSAAVQRISESRGGTGFPGDEPAPAPAAASAPLPRSSPPAASPRPAGMPGRDRSGRPAATPQAPATRSPSHVGRNDPCPCGSGKKYKNCCGRSTSAS